MNRFFGFGEEYFRQYGRFETFSVEHLLMLAGCIALWILSPLSMRNRGEKAQAVFRISLAGFMLFAESTWYIWYGLQHGLDVKISLPLQLCSFALYSSILLLFTGKQVFFELSYFLGLGGALQALITPNLEYHFLHVRWFHFTVIHFTLILVPLYFIIVQKYRITYKSLFRVMGISTGLMAFVMIMNQILGANYMFINGQPEFPSMIDVFVKIFGPWPFYIIGMLLLAFFIFIVLYLPFGERQLAAFLRGRRDARKDFE